MAMTLRGIAMSAAATLALALVITQASQLPGSTDMDKGPIEDWSDECADESCTGGLNLLQKNAELKKMQASGSKPQAVSHNLKPQAVPHNLAAIHTDAKVVADVVDAQRLTNFYQHLSHTVENGAQCSETTSNPRFWTISMTIPSIMVVLFAVGTYWLACVYPRPPASEQPFVITRVDENGYPVSINWHFVWWTGIGIGMANVNYVVVLPIAVENFSGSLWEAGFWVGLYAVGALISIPFFIKLGHAYTRTALALHGLTTLIGNLIMIYGAMVQSIPILMWGRVCTGLAFGIYYTCNNGCLYLIPTWDRLEAIFISRCVYSIGFALGPCISPLCNFFLTRQPWIMAWFPGYNAAAEGTPLILMALYGLAYTLGAIFCFTEVEQLDAVTEGRGIGDSAEDPTANNATWEERKQAIIMFSSVVFTNFSRNFIRVLWETGTVMILAKVYCVATGAGIVVSIVAITLVVSRNAMSKLAVACGGDNAKLMRVLEWGGALSCPFMFTWFLSPDSGTLIMFLIGGIIFYNANASQSGVLLALGGDAAIKGNVFLDKVALNTYMYVSMLVAYIFGPICTFVGQAVSPGQNTVATCVGVVTALQILVTYSSVKSKDQSLEDTFEDSSPMTKKKPLGKGKWTGLPKPTDDLSRMDSRFVR